jgi:uncharacterized protein (DUF362 family)
MKLSSKTVGLQRSLSYDREKTKRRIDSIFSALAFSLRPGDRVLLKPNLIGAQRVDGLACTHPQLIAAVAEWCLDCSVDLCIGDSPAFGSARGVMESLGIAEVLRGMPVKLLNFDKSRRVQLASGIEVALAAPVFECDVLINLPKVKAHSQLLVTLAVKNLFGIIVGMRKAWYHVQFGNKPHKFIGLLVDLLAVLPAGVTVVDGIIAMHETGPLKGKPFSLGVLAGSANPVALETAMMKILGLDPDRNPIWQECAHRKLMGTDHTDLHYPLLLPEEVAARGFLVPKNLQPVSFNPCRMAASAIKRVILNYKP